MSILEGIEVTTHMVDEEDLPSVTQNLVKLMVFFYVMPYPDGQYQVGVRKCDKSNLDRALGLPAI